jgi:hypothetical protein
VLAALLLGAFAACDQPEAVVDLKLEGRDYFLPPPAHRSVLFKLDARAAAPKTRLMFTRPLPGGRHRYRFVLTGSSPDRTFVVATPVGEGASSFEVSISGAGRFDFGFWSEGAAHKEYRFTALAPVTGQTFELEF